MLYSTTEATLDELAYIPKVNGYSHYHFATAVLEGIKAFEYKSTLAKWFLLHDSKLLFGYIHIDPVSVNGEKLYFGSGKYALIVRSSTTTKYAPCFMGSARIEEDGFITRFSPGGQLTKRRTDNFITSEAIEDGIRFATKEMEKCQQLYFSLRSTTNAISLREAYGVCVEMMQNECLPKKSLDSICAELKAVDLTYRVNTGAVTCADVVRAVNSYMPQLGLIEQMRCYELLVGLMIK